MHVVSRGVYFDTSTKGKVGKHHHSYRAEVRIDGVRRRARFLSHAAATRWVKLMRSQDDGEWKKLRAEREAKRAASEREREAARLRRLVERAKIKSNRLAERMVREIGTPWEKIQRRAVFAPIKERFGEILRRRIELVLNIPIVRRWQFAKLWSPQERKIAMEIDRARRAYFTGSEVPNG